MDARFVVHRVRRLISSLLFTLVPLWPVRFCVLFAPDNSHVTCDDDDTSRVRRQQPHAMAAHVPSLPLTSLLSSALLSPSFCVCARVRRRQLRPWWWPLAAAPPPRVVCSASASASHCGVFLNDQHVHGTRARAVGWLAAPGGPSDAMRGRREGRGDRGMRCMALGEMERSTISIGGIVVCCDGMTQPRRARVGFSVAVRGGSAPVICDGAAFFLVGATVASGTCYAICSFASLSGVMMAVICMLPCIPRLRGGLLAWSASRASDCRRARLAAPPSDTRERN